MKAMQRHAILLAGLMLLLAGAATAQQKSAVDAAVVDKAIEKSWAAAEPDWKARLAQDETQKVCSHYRNAPPADVAAKIVAREQAAIVYPADGKLMGDWKNGEKLAESGYGGRFTDYPARQPNGGNCYACHQLAKAQVSYGTLGPSLLEYGKIRKFAEADIKAVYERIYNPHAAIACANMPRLGASKFLTIDQIRDLVAYVMSPDSPVNK
jgi:L-cysteine S-thiosulfotransferase